MLPNPHTASIWLLCSVPYFYYRYIMHKENSSLTFKQRFYICLKQPDIQPVIAIYLVLAAGASPDASRTYIYKVCYIQIIPGICLFDRICPCYCDLQRGPRHGYIIDKSNDVLKEVYILHTHLAPTFSLLYFFHHYHFHRFETKLAFFHLFGHLRLQNITQVVTTFLSPSRSSPKYLGSPGYTHDK